MKHRNGANCPTPQNADAVLVESDVQPERSRRAWQARRLAPPRWSLVGILVVPTLLSLRLVRSNSAFNDKALYLRTWHGEIAHLIYGTKTPGFQTNFSGASVLYPVVRAVVGSNGGLGAACLLPLAFMLGASLLLYLTAARLFTRHAGLIAAASFAVLGQSSTWVPLLRMTRWRCCYWWRRPHLPHRPVPGLAVTELLTGVLLDMGPGTWLIFRRIHREEGG